jgi:hypothetical protein
MFDKLLTRARTQAQNELDEQLCHQRQSIQISLTALRSLGSIILDDEISDEELRARRFGGIGECDHGPRHLLTMGRSKTAASDGQRFSLPRRVLQQDLQHPIQRLRLGVLHFRGR